MYAGVVGAEMGTPDVGKRLLVEDIEVRDGEGKGATRERERDGVPVNVLYLYEKERETGSPQAVRTCLFRTRPDAITWRKVPHLPHRKLLV